MPGSTLPNTGLVLPSVGGDAGVWGGEVNDALSNYDAHNHMSGAGARVPTAGLNINADLSFSSLYAPTNLARAQFSAVVAATNNLSLFVSDGTSGLVTGELYWRNNTGNPVRFTAGNTLNFASFVGGIGGDYSSVGAAENFDDGQKQYTFKDGAAKWARLHAGNVRFAPFGTTSALFVEMAAPSALASNYTMTLPLALPASQQLIQITSAGVMSASNTVPTDVTLANITALSATVVANGSVTVSGTGDYKHGTRTVSIPVAAGTLVTGGAEFTTAWSATTITTGNSYRTPIVITVGARILAARAVIQDVAGGPSATCRLDIGLTLPGSSATSVFASSSASSGAGTVQTLTATPSAPLNVNVGATWLAVIQRLSGAQNMTLFSIEIDYDRP